MMHFPPLIHAKLVKRYKRFLADVILDDGSQVTVHVPNSGAMTSTLSDECSVYISYHDNPKRKLKYTLELTKPHDSLICTNTTVANTIASEAILAGIIKELQGYDTLKREQKYGQNSRIDILLESESQKCFVEVKSVTLKIDNMLAFPDAKTSRGQKHLDELMQMKSLGHRAVMLFIAQRSDADIFRIANEIDPIYAEKLKEAKNAGVEILCYVSKMTLNEISVSRALKMQI